MVAAAVGSAAAITPDGMVNANSCVDRTAGTNDSNVIGCTVDRGKTHSSTTREDGGGAVGIDSRRDIVVVAYCDIIAITASSRCSSD